MNDAEFIAAFEAAAIPPEQWTHRAHVRMAFLYLRDLRELPSEEALDRIRRGIRALNKANGIVDSPTEGYHETATVAWARVIASCIAHHGPTDAFESFASANPHRCQRTLLRGYYTRERIMSPEARRSFVEPDLAPLPASKAL